MEKWDCKIEKVNNGYICETYTPNSVDDEAYLIEKNLFAMECEEDTADVSAFVELVWHLAEYFGVSGSKHDAKRFWVGLKDKEKGA